MRGETMSIFGRWPHTGLRAGFSSAWASSSRFCCRCRVVLVLAAFGLLSFLWRRLRHKPPPPTPETTEPRRPEGDDEVAIGAENPCYGSYDRRPSDPQKVNETDEEEEEEEDNETDEEEEEEVDEEELFNDPLYCAYDSTWEETSSDSDQRVRRPTESSDYKFNRFQNAAKDMQNYRHDYPLSTGRRFQSNKGEDMPNLQFYLGKKPSFPDGVYIHEFHRKWWGDYSKLEQVHTYIQWLFPLQETGINYQAYELTKPEIEAFCNDDTAKLNLLASYKLMLDFYGIELSNPETGGVRRAENWQKRFKNLNQNSHNHLRLTRILKCLGTLGFGHYQAPLVHFFLEETLVHGNLPTVKESALNYFLFTVLDRAERRKLVRFAYLSYEPKAEFVLCPRKIQRRFASRKRAVWSSQTAS